MWRYLQQIGSLVKSFLHHLILLVVQMLDCLLQIAHATVDEFGAAAACPR